MIDNLYYNYDKLYPSYVDNYGIYYFENILFYLNKNESAKCISAVYYKDKTHIFFLGHNDIPLIILKQPNKENVYIYGSRNPNLQFSYNNKIIDFRSFNDQIFILYSVLNLSELPIVYSYKISDDIMEHFIFIYNKHLSGNCNEYNTDENNKHIITDKSPMVLLIFRTNKEDKLIKFYSLQSCC